MLMLASPAPAVTRLPGTPGPASVARRPAAIASLAFLLVLSIGFSVYSYRRLQSVDRELTTTREALERRLQKLDAGIHFDSRRQQLLLGVRDEILAVNPRLDADVAYEYSTALVAACEKYSAVDPILLLAVGTVESGFDPSATSPAQARGLYQIWPSTGRLLAGMLDWPYSDSLLFEPGKNTTLAAFYLQILFTVYKDESMVLAEYNGGPLNAGYLRAGDGRLSAETRRYVARVLDHRQRLRKKFEQPDGAAPALLSAREPSREGGRRLGERPRPAAAAPGRTAAAG